MTTNSHTCRFWSRENGEAYLFLSPWFTGFFLFLAFPIGYSLYLSLCRWDLISPSPLYVGFQNYHHMLTEDPRFWLSLKVTGLYALGSVPLCIIVALLLALLLNGKFRGIGLFRTIYYLPAVVSGVAVAVLWVGLLNPDFGMINQALRILFGWFNLPEESLPKWLFSQKWALPGLILMSLWGVGPGALVFLAGLQSIPQEPHEAAMIDGAGAGRRFLHITLPLLTPMILFNLIIGIIGSLQVFTQGYVMTGGGPRDATLFFVLYIWQKAFLDFQAGYASALAWVLFCVILVLTLAVLRSSRMWVHYGGEDNG
ncbi:MAG: sugar ABC transporter permease [Candidatus Omnitrophica bacterium]|nr:MAG: Lactose transport system permease protein LacF [Candidatus Hinthialibacteria bacterium OLB16]MBE7487117.1 sugar ABC transporter permease [bacterium]MBW7937641.1 sugar ABC transporter permease [Candidatus Omnitrophota bacterium]MCE7909199.1 sugar ABC transporter permease [Candidatus Omnitrophica bacterium COP1]MBV6481097.1 Lactose transport system permease protein LacF [bacterium]